MKLHQEYIIRHLTINAFNISQFENHIRAVCELEKIMLKKQSNASYDKYSWEMKLLSIEIKNIILMNFSLIT